jgi:hypothetical protein
MSSFFEPPPPPPEPPEWPVRPPRRPWHGVPSGVVGRTVALNLVLGQSAKAVVWIPSVTAYPDGFELQLEIRERDGEAWSDQFGLLHHRGGRRPDGELDPELFRFGIELSDGRKATSLNPGTGPGDWDTPPAGPILSGGGGGGGGLAGGGARLQYGYWVWPLPPEGPLAFVCEWPIADIPETRTEIDSGLLRDAAAKAITVWPENEGEASHGGASTAGTVQRVVLTPDPSKPPEAAEFDEAS